jgi:hypothetical protein
VRVAFFLFSIFVVTAGINARAEAQNYPWCTYYSKDGTNCGFVSFEQCLADVRGIGGFCQQNILMCRPPARIVALSTNLTATRSLHS